MVVIDNCYPGAVAEILSYGTKIGGGIVAGETTVFPVNPPLKAGANQLSVKQSLCGKEMGESTTYDVTDSLDSFKKPYIETPICDGSDRVPVCNTFTGYTVRVFDEANVNEPLAEAGATGSCRTPILDKKATLKNGQNIYAEQEFGAMQKKSDIIEVGKNPGPLFGVINGDCHGVFKRETFTGANGPIFRAALCGGLEPYVDIIGPNGNPTTTINLVKTNQKGYFENTWIVDPAAMPEGTYTARFHIADSSGEKQEVKFFSVYSLKSPESKVKLEVLCAHNKVREEVHSENPSVPPIDPLIWSDKLASSAQNWAEHLASIGKLEHSGSGENLSSIGSSYTDSIESWADEKKDNLQDSWANELWSGQSHKFPDAGPQVCACPGNCKGQNLCYISKTCDFCDFGHYTQIVWRGTNEVGCGEKDGIRVCQYAPAGNTWGGKVY
jgi:hypothetical protein